MQEETELNAYKYKVKHLEIQLKKERKLLS